MCPIDIRQVPPDEGRGIMPTSIFNPTNEDFEIIWDGKVQGIVPAGKSLSVPEFLAKHAAKHLAELIVNRKWKIKVNEESVGQLTPDTAKAVPKIEIQKMMEACLKGNEEAFLEMEKPIGKIEFPKPQGEVPKIEVKIPEKTPEEIESERKSAVKARRQAAAARAREVMRAKREMVKKQNSNL